MRARVVFCLLPLAVACDGETVAIAPTADAGFDQHVDVGDVVTLDGRASSNTGGGTLFYRWRMAYKPSQSVAAIVPSDAATPEFTADIAGTYLVVLEVTNGKRLSTPDEVVVVAEQEGASNRAPVAVARACLVPPCSLAHEAQGSLLGTGSLDPDADPITYLWTQVLPGECATMCPALSACDPIGDLVNWTARNVSGGQYDPPYAVGQLVFQLQVSDPYTSSSACAAVELTNNAPKAFIQSGSFPTSVPDAVPFDTLAVTTGDTDGDDLTYEWSLWQGNAGSGTLIDTVAANVPADSTVPAVTLTPPDVASDTAFTLRILVSDGLIDEALACAGAPTCPTTVAAATSCCEIDLTVLNVN